MREKSRPHGKSTLNNIRDAWLLHRRLLTQTLPVDLDQSYTYFLTNPSFLSIDES